MADGATQHNAQEATSVVAVVAPCSANPLWPVAPSGGAWVLPVRPCPADVSAFAGVLSAGVGEEVVRSLLRNLCESSLFFLAFRHQQGVAVQLAGVSLDTPRLVVSEATAQRAWPGQGSPADHPRVREPPNRRKKSPESVQMLTDTSSLRELWGHGPARPQQWA